MTMKNKLYKLIIFSLIFGAADFAAFAQLNCGTTQATNKLFELHPELKAASEASNLAELIRDQTPEYRSHDSTIYIIPIVFHVIHEGGSENISDAQIHNQVAILNRDYRRKNSDTISVVNAFKPLITDTYIEFRLAQIDPNGNCTNGIDRIYSHKTNAADDNSKLNQWPRNKYLNVWTVKTIGTAGVAGYAYYPSSVAGFLYPYDGILILHDYIGSIGTSSTNSSRALTHEIGHYLNLSHPWGNTNDPGVSCGDDGVSDTPPTKGHTACTTADKFTPNCTIYPITATYQFDSLLTTSGTTDPTPVPLITGTVYSPFIASGVAPNTSVPKEFSYAKWGTGAADGATTYASLTGAINTSKYYEFTVTPSSISYNMTLTALTLKVKRSATGPRTWAVRSSKDAFAANIGGLVTPTNTNIAYQSTPKVFFMAQDSTSKFQKGTKISLPAASYANLSVPVTFRIYAFNAEDTLGTFAVDSVFLGGTDGLIENTENYMDYSYCSKMYTPGQKDRMRTALESPVSYRNNLWSAANTAATGVDNPVTCLAKPEFYVSKPRICATNSTKFTKNILYGRADSIRWDFPGGTPSTSTDTTPVLVTYANAGLYTVTLTAYNSAGSNTVTKTDYIRVDENWGAIDYNGSYSEAWENSNTFYWDWSVKNYDDNATTWLLDNTHGFGGSKCVYINAYGNYEYDVDDLISPTFDLSFTSLNIFSFKSCGASRAGAGSDVNDEVNLYGSTNCGNTWTLVKSFHDSSLINNGYHPEDWAPDANSTWTIRYAPLPTSLNVGNVRFKLEYKTGTASNNVFLDDFNITGVVGVNENFVAVSTVSIYPNPANQTSTIAYHLSNQADTKIAVVDVLGKTVFSQTNNGQPEGDYAVTISKQNLHLNNGIYFVKFSVNNEAVTKKLIISE